MNTTLSQILEHKIVAILRGIKLKDIVPVSEALYLGGIRVLEITMNSARPMAAIEEAVDKLGEKMVIGAGTVLDPETARSAILCGAKFILSPTVDKDTIKMCRRYGAVCVPGAYTPTEIIAAYSAGGDIIKVFPANSPAYLKDIAGPLPHIPLLPTGGVNLENIREFKKAGAVGFGLGGSLVDSKQEITEEYLKRLTEKAGQFVSAVAE